MSLFKEEMYKESNAAAIQFAKNAIQFSFLLNGAAATALFAKTGTSFISSACTFAIGAAFSTLCMGATYIVQTLICETWRQEGIYIQILFCGKIIKISHATIELLRAVAIVIWIISMILFFTGAYMAANTFNNTI